MLKKYLQASRWLSGSAGAVHETRVSQSLRANRHSLAVELMQNLANWEKYAQQIRAHQANLESYVKIEFYVFIDYLCLYLDTCDTTYKMLYIAEKLKQLFDNSLAAEKDDENRRRVTEDDIRVLCGHIRAKLGPDEEDVLKTLLREIQGIVTAHGRKELGVLLIGDCVYLDLMGFLVPLALEDGITIRPTFITTKNPAEQRNSMRRLAEQRFDLIFYSPFTYEFSVEFSESHNWRNAVASRGWVNKMVCNVMDEVTKNLDLLATLWDAPTYVHNTVNIRRHNSTLRELAKTLISRRVRRLARLQVKSQLAEMIASRRAADANLILFDEADLLSQHGELALGRTIYESPLQHPAELGRHLAHHYGKILAVHVNLMGKKVVVCDLDNTLWKGEIGEGEVEHFIRVQLILKELRRKGVLLAVNSKNDPHNVQWHGGVLNQDDFVNLQINWNSKVSNMRRIQQALNIKLKDFVFIDDRPDQRSMVGDAIPEIYILDPTIDRTWVQLAIWAAALPENPETDRTQQYREREQRESFLAAAVEEDPATLFQKLEIRIEIREARASELKRVTELINRTNQFNLAGSRTSLKAIRQWHDTAQRQIVVVEASDKYGPMGLVCAALLDLSEPEILIPVFVLSCRVFGYGIEDAVLNAFKRRAHSTSELEMRPIRGDFRETSHNEPCHRMYPENGFSWDGHSWILRRVELSNDPPWLTVVDAFSTVSAALMS